MENKKELSLLTLNSRTYFKNLRLVFNDII